MGIQSSFIFQLRRVSSHINTSVAFQRQLKNKIHIQHEEEYGTILNEEMSDQIILQAPIVNESLS